MTEKHQKKTLVIRMFRVRCEKCDQLLEWRQEVGNSRTIRVVPCEKCSTTVTKMLTIGDLRQLTSEALAQSRREAEREDGAPQEAKVTWQQQLEGLLAQVCYCLRESESSDLTATAVVELEATLKESRGKLYEYLDRRIGRVAGVARQVKIEKRPGVDWDAVIDAEEDEETEVDEKEYYQKKKKKEKQAQRKMAQILGVKNEENKT